MKVFYHPVFCAKSDYVYKNIGDCQKPDCFVIKNILFEDFYIRTIIFFCTVSFFAAGSSLYDSTSGSPSDCGLSRNLSKSQIATRIARVPGTKMPFSSPSEQLKIPKLLRLKMFRPDVNKTIMTILFLFRNLNTSKLSFCNSRKSS